ELIQEPAKEVVFVQRHRSGDIPAGLPLERLKPLPGSARMLSLAWLPNKAPRCQSSLQPAPISSERLQKMHESDHRSPLETSRKCGGRFSSSENIQVCLACTGNAVSACVNGSQPGKRKSPGEK